MEALIAMQLCKDPAQVYSDEHWVPPTQVEEVEEESEEEVVPVVEKD